MSEKEFTHYLVPIPRAGGRYEAPDGTRVDILKVPKSKNLSTTREVYEGTTITQFIQDHGYSKT